MCLKHRIASLGFLLVFLSAWVPSSVAHAIDPHHGHEFTNFNTVDESDHCPYCEIELSVFTPGNFEFYKAVTQTTNVPHSVYIPSFSFDQAFSLHVRGPPAC
jgi:hypothetical protein